MMQLILPESTCPADFTLPLVTLNDPESTITPAPNPADIIYPPGGTFQYVDHFVQNEIPTNFQNFTHLLWHLCFSQPRTDLEKVRILYKWLLNSPLSGRTTFSQSDNAEEQLFLQLNERKTPLFYTNLLRLLCNYVGVPCVIISGYVKDMHYACEDNLVEHDCNHQWNAVKLAAHWYLIDMHWNDRYCIVPVPERLAKLYPISSEVPSHFIMDPHQAVYTHLPNDNRWQLLSLDQPSLTMHQFASLPKISQACFQVGLSILESPYGVIKVVNGCCQIELPYTATAEFAFQLRQLKDGCNTESVDEKVLNAFGALETKENRVVVYLRLPLVGIYYLTIFGRLIQKLSEWEAHNKLEPMLQYTLVCNAPCPHAFPITYFWHINCGVYWPLAYLYEVSPISREQSIVTVALDAKPTLVTFCFAKNNDAVEFLVKMRHPNDGKDTVGGIVGQYDNTLLVSCNNTPLQCDMTVQVVKVGLFVCEIYAKMKSEVDRKFHILAVYLVECNATGQSEFLCEVDLEVDPLPSIGCMPDPYTIAEPPKKVYSQP